VAARGGTACQLQHVSVWCSATTEPRELPTQGGSPPPISTNQTLSHRPRYCAFRENHGFPPYSQKTVRTFGGRSKSYFCSFERNLSGKFGSKPEKTRKIAKSRKIAKLSKAKPKRLLSKPGEPTLSCMEALAVIEAAWVCLASVSNFGCETPFQTVFSCILGAFHSPKSIPKYGVAKHG
jgi:hypothetical protein